jgi:hypothetical protein
LEGEISGEAHWNEAPFIESDLASNVLAGMGGALIGGSTGAFTASNADL